MRSLRAREFAAIAIAVLVSVGVTLVLAFVLVQRSVHGEALQALARQVALIEEQQRAESQINNLDVFLRTQQQRLSILSLSTAAQLLPPAGGEALREGHPAQGTVDVNGQRYLYAARPTGQRAIVLLRSATLEASSRRPFTIAFGVAAAVGATIAAIAAFLLAAAVARPITRVAVASQKLAAGEPPGPLPVKGSSELAALAAAFNQMADDLQRAREAERSFLLSVSHELKTPLASIRGHGEALLDGVMGVPQAAGVVVSEAKRLERLVRDLLDLARLNQRSFTVSPHAVDLSLLVDEALGRHEAESRRVDVALAGDADAPAPAWADPDRVLQILSNLIENALRCTPAGGSVTVSAEPGGLTVADTGPGLAPDELPHAFERFFLYSRYAANRAVGTGLGLAIVKELVDAMDGTIDVASAPGQGTRFAIRLPAAPPESTENAYVAKTERKRSADTGAR